MSDMQKKEKKPSVWTIVGLGNPGEEYESTRHNTGRMAVMAVTDDFLAKDWSSDYKSKSLVSGGKIGGKKALFVLPDNFMNNSGECVKKSIKVADMSGLVVLYDDLDLPLGTIRVSYNRGDGGHKGLASIIKALKTEAFVRVRVGVTPVTPSGVLKKPLGEDAVVKFILGKWQGTELKNLNQVFKKKVLPCLSMIIENGREKAMGEFNRG